MMKKVNFTEKKVSVSMERMIYILTGKGKDEFLRGLGHNEFCNENEGEGRKTCTDRE
jgi:hypothetical protein